MRDEFLRMLYEKHFETVFDYCLPKLGFDNDAAADCAHAVFDEAGKQYEKLANHPNLLGWLMTTAKHKLHKAWRRSTRERLRLIPLDLAEAVPDGGDPFAAVELTAKASSRSTRCFTGRTSALIRSRKGSAYRRRPQGRGSRGSRRSSKTGSPS